VADFGGGGHNGFFGGFNNFGNAVAPVGLAPPPGFVPGVGIAPVVPGAPGNVAFFNNNTGFGGRGDSDWFATARVRVGWAFDRSSCTPPAASRSPIPATTIFGPSGGLIGHRGNDDWGWALGGGVE
jgi:hypothetical protein